jgi:hypothetical protein
VQHSIDVELAFVFPDVVEGDVLSMPEEPGGFVIEGGIPLLKGTHPEDYWDTAALGAQGMAWWGHGAAGPWFSLN